MIINKITALSQPLKNLYHARNAAICKKPSALLTKTAFKFSQQGAEQAEYVQTPQKTNEEQQQEGQQEGQEIAETEQYDETTLTYQQQEVIEKWSLIGKHLTLNKFYWQFNDEQFYEKMERKLKDYEEEIGLSLSTLHEFPLSSKENKVGQMSKPVAFQRGGKQVTSLERSKVRKHLMIQSMNREHLLVTSPVIEEFIRILDIQLLQAMRKTGAFAVQSTIGFQEVKKLIDHYFKGIKSEDSSELLLNYIPYSFHLECGLLRGDHLDKETENRIIDKIPEVNGTRVDKMRLTWALLRLSHKYQNTKQIINQQYSSKNIKFLVRQLNKVRFSEHSQKTGGFKTTFSRSKGSEKMLIEQELHRLILLSYGEGCLAPITNWMVNYFITYEEFHKNSAMLSTLLYLIEQEASENNIFTEKSSQKYYQVILNMIKNNITFKDQPKSVYEHFLFEIIPANLHNNAFDPKLFPIYQKRVRAWKDSSDYVKNHPQQHEPFVCYSGKCANPLLARILRNLERRQLVLQEFSYDVPNKVPQELKYTTIQEFPVKKTNLVQLKDNTQPITQIDFVKNLIGENYEKVYEYFVRHFKPMMHNLESTFIREESVDKFYHFENDNVKAFYLLWRHSKQLRERAAPQTLKKFHLEIKERVRLETRHERGNQLEDQSERREDPMFSKKKMFGTSPEIVPVEKIERFEDIEHIERIERPKYNQRKKNRDDSKWINRRKQNQIGDQGEDLAIDKLDRLDQTFEDGESQPQRKGNNHESRKSTRNNPVRAGFSTMFDKSKSNQVEQPAENVDGYQLYRKTVKQITPGIKIFNFDHCKTAADLQKQFESKKNLLNQNNYKEVITNNKIPIVRRGEKLFKFFFLNNNPKGSQITQSNTLPQIPADINSLSISFQAEIGLIEKDYNQYLKSCSFMFPLAYETYLSLLDDQLRSYHRKSFKIVVSHRIAFAHVNTSNIYAIDNRFIELLCEICVKERIGITLLEIAYLIYSNGLRISESALEKICSTLYVFNALREDAFDFAQKFCIKSGIKFKFNYFKSYCVNLISQKNYIELEMISNKLIRELKEKPYKFDPSLSNEDNELLEKEWKGKEKNRYINEIFQMLQFMSESIDTEVPEFLAELYDLYLEIKDNRSNLSSSEYIIGIIVYSWDKEKFGELIRNLEKEPNKVTIGTFPAFIKSFSIYPRQLSEYLEPALRMTLYEHRYDLKETQLLKLTDIFVRIDKPMIFSTFMEHLIKVEQEFSEETKAALYRVLRRTEDDQSKERLFELLGLLFDKNKAKERAQLHKTMLQEEKKRKSIEQITSKIKLVVSEKELLQLEKPVANSQKKEDPKFSAKSNVKSSAKAETPKTDKSFNPKNEAKTPNVNSKSNKGIPNMLDGSNEDFDSKITFATYEKSSKTTKRNKSLKKFAETYLFKEREEEDPKKKDKKGKK